MRPECRTRVRTGKAAIRTYPRAAFRRTFSLRLRSHPDGRSMCSLPPRCSNLRREGVHCELGTNATIQQSSTFLRILGIDHSCNDALNESITAIFQSRNVLRIQKTDSHCRQLERGPRVWAIFSLNKKNRIHRARWTRSGQHGYCSSISRQDA